MVRRIKGRAALGFALGVLLLRVGSGPALLAIQLLTGGVASDPQCGNAALRFPNTDLVSWWISRRTAAAFNEACVIHDQCYNTLGTPKSACDRAFLADMQAGCDQVYSTLDAPGLIGRIGKGACRLEAETYWVSVAALPPLRVTYCYEQHYARVGSRDDVPDLVSLLRECWSER